MREVFVDTSYLIAIFNPNDDLHKQAKTATHALDVKTQYISSKFVIAEFLNFMSPYSSSLRNSAIKFTDELESSPDYLVSSLSDEDFSAAKNLYAARGDKSYSFTDCTSMHISKIRGITMVLTYDEHFQQEGFIALLR